MKKYDIGEADRMYVVYTAESGKIKVLAKGVRKSGAKLAGFLENFNLVGIFVAKNHGAGKITGVIVENYFSILRRNFEILAGVFENFQLIEKMVQWEQEDRRFFDLMLSYLRAVEREAGSAKKWRISVINLGFFFKALALLGYQLEVNKCVLCRKKLFSGRNFFSAEQGGIVCESCAPKISQRVSAGENCVKIMRIFFQSSLESLFKLQVGEKDVKQLNFVAREFARWINS